MTSEKIEVESMGIRIIVSSTDKTHVIATSLFPSQFSSYDEFRIAVEQVYGSGGEALRANKIAGKNLVVEIYRHHPSGELVPLWDGIHSMLRVEALNYITEQVWSLPEEVKVTSRFTTKQADIISDLQHMVSDDVDSIVDLALDLLRRTMHAQQLGLQTGTMERRKSFIKEELIFTPYCKMPLTLRNGE